MVLITGADGYLGSELARRYVAAGRRVVCWVHAASSDALAQKRARLKLALGPAFAAIQVAGGDLRAPQPFADIEAIPDEIVHAAAITRFDVPQFTAHRVNVEGTAKVVAFAARCRNLSGLSVLSSIYATGLTAGRVVEEPIRGTPRFANWYEWSKCLAEQAVLRAPAGLPWRILRIATAVADDDSGRVTQRNALHQTLQLVHQGLLSVVPGEPTTPVYLVTRAYVADACIALTQRNGPTQRIYHVAPRREHTPNLGDLLDAAFATFNAGDGFRRRRILKPPFCGWDAFERLRVALQQHGSVLAGVVGSMAPFARQLYVAKDIDNGGLLEGGVEPPRVDGALLERTCRYLIAQAAQKPRKENAP